MSGYEFSVHCAYCDGECRPVAESKSFRWDTRAVAKCVRCNTVWTLVVQMITDTQRGQSYASPATVEQLKKARDLSAQARDKRWHKA